MLRAQRTRLRIHRTADVDRHRLGGQGNGSNVSGRLDPWANLIRVPRSELLSTPLGDQVRVHLALLIELRRIWCDRARPHRLGTVAQANGHGFVECGVDGSAVDVGVLIMGELKRRDESGGLIDRLHQGTITRGSSARPRESTVVGLVECRVRRDEPRHRLATFGRMPHRMHDISGSVEDLRQPQAQRAPDIHGPQHDGTHSRHRSTDCPAECSGSREAGIRWSRRRVDPGQDRRSRRRREIPAQD